MASPSFGVPNGAQHTQSNNNSNKQSAITADDDQQAMAILTQMSQSQAGAKASPGLSLPFRGPNPPAAAASSQQLPAPPHSPSTASTRSPGPGPPLASIRTNPALFRPDSIPGSAGPAGYASVSASGSESYLSRAPVAGSSSSAAAGGGGGGYTKLPPIDSSRSRQSSVALRSLPPSRQTSLEPLSGDEDELASPKQSHTPGLGGGGRPPQAKKRTSGGGPEGFVNGTPDTDGTPAPNAPVDWTRTRKDNHKEVERRRRETINEGINELKLIVPGCEKNKGSILQRAVEYINELKELDHKNVEKWTLEALLNEQASAELRHELDNYKRHFSLLEQDNATLRAENNTLRAELGRPPLGAEIVSASSPAAGVKGEGANNGVAENGFGLPAKRASPGEVQAAEEKRPRLE